MSSSRWDVALKGPCTAKNVGEFYKKRGYLTMNLPLSPGHKFDRHRHTADSVVVIVSGTYAFNFSGKIVEVSQGEYFEPPVGEYHMEEVVGDEPVQIAFATKEFFLGLIFRAYNVQQWILSFFKKSTQD
eukprot:g3196.t1